VMQQGSKEGHTVGIGSSNASNCTADHGNKFILPFVQVVSWTDPHNNLIKTINKHLFVRVSFILLRPYFVSFILLTTPGSSATGRCPSSPALLLCHTGQGCTLQPLYTPETDSMPLRRPFVHDGTPGPLHRCQRASPSGLLQQGDAQRRAVWALRPGGGVARWPRVPSRGRAAVPPATPTCCREGGRGRGHACGPARVHRPGPWTSARGSRCWSLKGVCG
jgi:hypothetical protein